MKMPLSLVLLMSLAFAGCISNSFRDRLTAGDPGLALTIEQPTHPFLLSQPIMLHARFLNTSSNHVEAMPFCPEGTITARSDVTSSHGQARMIHRQSVTLIHVERVSGRASALPDLYGQVVEFEERDPISLQPGKSALFVFDLKKTPEGEWSIDAPGRFVIWVDYEAKGSKWEGKVESNRIRITVR